MRNYNLLLHEPVRAGGIFINEITPIAKHWERSIRLQGGSWTGSFELSGPEVTHQTMRNWFYTRLGCHLVEKMGGADTWQGMIYEMDFDETPKNPKLKVNVCGYMFTASWNEVTGADGSLTTASAWVTSILTANCSEFLSLGKIDTNALTVRKKVMLNAMAWDELLRIAELGGPNAKPWRLYCGNDRRVSYTELPNTPNYYVYGGIRRRRSLALMANSVPATYTDEAGAQATAAAVTNPQSIARYGTKTERLILENIPLATVQANQAAFLAERGWASPQAVVSMPGIKVFTSVDTSTKEIAPWSVRPGVFRDVSHFAGTNQAPSGSFYLSAADFLVDEVHASVDNGLSLRTGLFSEAELLEQYERYANDQELDDE